MKEKQSILLDATQMATIRIVDFSFKLDGPITLRILDGIAWVFAQAK